MIQSSQTNTTALSLQCPPAVLLARQNKLSRFEDAVQRLSISCRLSDLEALIFRNEYGAPPLTWLSDTERWERLNKLWAEVSMLTGAVMYADNYSRSLQQGMLETFIMSNAKYAGLTLDEIRHAFYLNTQGELADSAPPGSGGIIRHYNTELNAEYVGAVLKAYITKRARIHAEKGDDVQQAMRLTGEAPQPPEITADQWQQMIEDDYQRYCRREVNMILNTSPKYIFLRKCGLIRFSSKAKWHEWYREALRTRGRAARAGLVKQFADRIVSEKAISMYEAINTCGVVPHYEHESVLLEMRRLVYLKFLEISETRGREAVFSCSIKNRLCQGKSCA